MSPSLNESHHDPHEAAAQPTESTSLLNYPSESEVSRRKRPTPIPKAQLATICLIRIADPIAFTQIFPYINEFVYFLRITDDPLQTGFYSGIVESSFAIAQFLAIFQWTSWANSIGRRPIVMAGTIGVAISTVFFGLSTSLAELIIWRSVAGISAGTCAVVQSVVGEMTDPTNQASVFTLYAIAWPLGSIIGPLIGGSLSSPATRISTIFENTIFSRHPYFLPCLVAGSLALFGVVLGYVCLEETLPSKCSKNLQSTQQDSPENIDGAVSADESSHELGIRELLSIPIIRALTLSGFALNFNYVAFDVVFVLFCYTPVENGGLSFPPSKIGYTLACSGLLAALAQVLFMPAILRRFESSRVYNNCMFAWPFVFLILPFLNVFARRAQEQSTGSLSTSSIALLWAAIGVVIIIARVGSFCHYLNMILIKSNVPNPSILASSNGLVQCAMCLARTISAAFASSAFAFSEEHHLFGGYLWALLLSFLGFIGCSLGPLIVRHSQSTLKHL